MTDFDTLLRADRGETAATIHLVAEDAADEWVLSRSAPDRALLTAARFGSAADTVLLPGDDAVGAAHIVRGDPVWSLAALPPALPPGTYRLSGDLPPGAALGWLLAQHRFVRYRAATDAGSRCLLLSDPNAIEPALGAARATARVRDLIDTPAEDMGPADLEGAVTDLSRRFGGECTVTRGEALRTRFPLIHAVGRAAERAREPRLVEWAWGDPAHPRVAVVGKGVSFDTGGLDIKPASGMRLMKKDMGGAAHAIALAEWVAAANLPVRLHLLVPAVENAIAGASLRPGDVVRAADGTTVEIHNTDAEGRLILADALTRAGEGQPELTLDFATLTGAARVALGPDLPALFARRDDTAAAFLHAGQAVGDPAWRMPLWERYHSLLASDIADVANAGDTPFAGAVTAALFLDRFVRAGADWLHLDTFGWRPKAEPGRPKGGEAYGLRAAFALLAQRFG